MSKVECPICHNIMNITSATKNVMIIDGVVAHRKCPKKPMSEKDAYEYRLLLDKIKYYINVNPNPKCSKTGFNWANITNKIKQLKDQGYTYWDMLYTLDEVVKLQGCFWGFGSVVNNIDTIMYRKKKSEELDIKHVPQTVDFTDLKVIEDDIDW